MNKNKKLKFCLIICLFLIEICSLFLTYKSYGNKILDNVKEEYEVEKETFSMYVETKDNEGNISYEEYNESEIFPTGYKINLEKSKCTDTKGNVIDGVLSGRGNKVTITSNKTAYCYIYFDIDYTLSQLCNSGDNLGTCLTTNNEEIDSLNDNIEGGMYRYQGTNIDVDDNYICFGTVDKSECTSNTDAYMYRIIGIDENNQLKLIKKEALNEKREWWQTHNENKIWIDSILYEIINTSSYLFNSTYVPSGWANKIINYEWRYGDTTDTISNNNGIEIYNSETQWTNKVIAKIGLMYAHDYYLGYDNLINCHYTKNEYTKCKTSWLHISNNDLENSLIYEWTMSRYGYRSYYDDYGVNIITSEGDMKSYGLANKLLIRPVFYLNSDEQYISGDGTINNPIIISGPIMHTVNVSSTNTTYGTVTPTTQEVVDTGNATITIIPNTGYKYSSNTCGVEPIDNAITISNVTSDKECIVTFEPSQYGLTLTKGTGISTIYYKINGASSYTSATSTQTLNVNYGTTYYYYGTASTGYTISSCTASSPCSGTMGTSAVSKTISATLNTYGLTLTKGTGISTIYYKINGASSYTSATSTKTLNVNYGSTYYYYGTASTGYTISSCTASSPCSGTMGTSAVSKTLSATLNKYTVAVSSTNTSYGTVSPASQSINHGSAATITLSPKTGYKYSSNTCGGTVSGNTMTISNVTSAKTCTVTFTGTPFGEYLISAKTAGWNSTAYSGMYRYIGTTANNYVKIGDVLYRIIGVTSAANSTLGLAANQVKVIKAASIGTHNWHSSYSVNATWNTGGTDAAMYTYLQGTSVLGSTSVIPSGWSSKISSVKWNVGDVQTYTNGDTVYGLEDNTQTTNTSKIGLMYMSDYYYAYNAGGTTNCNSTACTNWLTDTSNSTWTMTRYGRSSLYFAWYVLAGGYVVNLSLNNTSAVRPVFYLSTSVNWKSGTGASGDPFIIE